LYFYYVSSTTENSTILEHYVPKKDYEKLLYKCEDLQGQLSELQRLIFGSKSERFIACSDATQLGLFQKQEADTDSVTTEDIQYTRDKPSSKKKPVRHVLPAHLPRIEEVIEPDTIYDGAKKIGEEVTELLEYNPAQVYVRRIVRPKYVLPQNDGIIIAKLPTLPLAKSNAGASLLSHILVSKFVNHLPFYRQIQIFKRQQLVLSDATISGWFNAATDLIQPLYQTLEKQLLLSNYLQADESPIGVQDSHKKGKLHTGYHWVYHAPVERLVLFKYDKSRSAKAPQRFLQKYTGTLQTDGYKVYQNLQTQGSIKLLSCMAHARRYFEKALDNDKSRASYALQQIQRLYAMERKVKERAIDTLTKKRYRDIVAKPILEQLKKWLEDNRYQVLPKSSIAKAITYSLRLWKSLESYTQDGNYLIDNNLIENAIRPLALGRKNYLFAGSHKAAQKAAMMYSFFASCKINDVEPYAWLKDILERIPDHKANKLEELLPHNYKQPLCKSLFKK